MRKNGRMLFGAALLLTLLVLFSATAFAAGGFAERLGQVVASAPIADRSSVWRYYSDGAAKQGAGNYSGAVNSYAAALKYFAAHSEPGNDANEINAYRQIAECYGAAAEYGMASAAWSAAARRCEAYIAAHPNEPGKIEEQIGYERNAAALSSVSQLYLKTSDPTQGSGTYFGVSGEPVNGIVMGAYAEGDGNVHDAYGAKRYWDEYPSVTGVDTGIFLLYLDYGMPLSSYESHVSAARTKGFAIELALQPNGGLDAVRDDAYLRRLAKDVAESGVQFYIRFAGEMNDPSGGNSWYTTDTAKYICAFRTVAGVFHTDAPTAAMVWSPNFYPSYNIADYYPGDEYVDIVGVSLYMSYRPELNPLGNGVENRRWIDLMEPIYELYGDRKPIMISEGAVCLAAADGSDLSDFAAEQLEDLFRYLPIRYPNVKFIVWFDTNDVVGNDAYSAITSNQTVLDAYRQAVRNNPSMVSAVDAPAAPVYYGKLGSGSDIVDGPATLCSYVKGVEPIASVVYESNGVKLAESKTAPYEVTVDFSAFRGQTVPITVRSYYANGALAGVETFTLNVAGTPDRGTAYARSQTVELDGRSVTLPAYALKDARGYETNYVKLRDLASLMNGTAAQFNVNWDGAVNIAARTAYVPNGSEMTTPFSGDRVYRNNTAVIRINGAAVDLQGIVLTDDAGGGYTYFKLRDIGKALGFNVGWSGARGIYIESSRSYTG